MSTISSSRAKVGDRVTGRLPLVSVVVEGWNEVALDTSLEDTLDHLSEQDYPLDRVELVLVGAQDERYSQWERSRGRETRFHRVLTLHPGDVPYYELKNCGVEAATGEIIAFTDSDVRPHPSWLSSIVDAITAGADLTAGLSTLWDRTGGRVPQAVLDAAASVSFAHVIGEDGNAAGLVAHNLALRAGSVRNHPFLTQPLARNTSVARLFQEQLQNGARIRFVPGQRVDHSFSPLWFVYPFHVRVGWEEYTLRRVSAATPNRWMRGAGPLEPALTLLWYSALDLRAWFKFGSALGLSSAECRARSPVLIAVSLTARTAGMLGAYAAMLMPASSRRWAERH